MQFNFILHILNNKVSHFFPQTLSEFQSEFCWQITHDWENLLLPKQPGLKHKSRNCLSSYGRPKYIWRGTKVSTCLLHAFARIVSYGSSVKLWNLTKYLSKIIYTTIGIVKCTLGLATDDLAVKPFIPHKSLLQWICCMITWK